MSNFIDKMKEFFSNVGKFILKNGKYFFPGFALILAAGFAAAGLYIRSELQKKEAAEEEARRIAEEQAQQLAFENSTIPLQSATDEKLIKLINDYYASLSNGDNATLTTICHNIDESEVIRLMEQSNYLSYSVSNIYNQVGPEEGIYIVYVVSYVVFDEYSDIQLPSYNGFYVKTSEEGAYYIEKGEFTDEELVYIDKVASQDDVVELKNRINVDYNDIVLEHQEVLDYLVKLDNEVSTSVGERIAELNAANEIPEEVDTPEDGEGGNIPIENQTLYATALTNVNVRASDSAQSDRLGEAQKGERYEVVEELENGWTKIIYNDQEAFIKSEFLSMAQSAEGQKTIGMITAKQEVNIRSLADQNSERLGALVKNDQLELVAVEDGWCTVKYDGMLAYVLESSVEYTVFEDN